MALLTLPSLKKRLGVTDTDDDGDLTDIVTEATYAVTTFLGFDPATVGDTVTANPNGSDVLVIPKAGPTGVFTITAVYEDATQPPTFDSTTLLTAGTDYTQKRAGSPALVRLGRNWPADVRREYNRLAGTYYPSVGSVQITYTVDYSAALAAAKRAALAEALALWNVANGGMGLGAVVSDSMDGASVTINTSLWQQRKGGTPFVSPVAAAMLDPHRLPVLG